MNTVLHVERTASGTAELPLVCLHGWGMNLRVFDGVRAAFERQRDTWALDLAGHGRSLWQDEDADFATQASALLAQLPPRCVLLGWSFGGKLALEIAAREPKCIAALVLVSATPKFAQSQDWPHGMGADAMQAFHTVLRQDWQQTLSDFVWLQLRGSRNAEAAQRTLETALTEHGAPQPVALGAVLDVLGTIDLRARVTQITQPVLLVSGENDRVTPPAAARWLVQSLSDATLVQIPRAGHAPFVSHPQEFHAALESFLDDLAAHA